MDPRLESLNTLLVETFNAILKVEEQSLRRATRETVTVTELHLLDAVAQDEQATISSPGRGHPGDGQYHDDRRQTSGGETVSRAGGKRPTAVWCGCA